jgi:hypothetical protein
MGVVMGVVMGLGSAAGCGGVTVHQVSPASPHTFPAITVERIQQCVVEHGEQLGPGNYNFHPVVEVDPNGITHGVETLGIPHTAPDLAGCMHSALRDMAIPASIFTMRPTQSASTNEPTVEQRSYVANPAVVVVVVVVVEVGEIVLEAGAITILFATTVKVVEKAKDDVLDAAKRWRRKPTMGRCLDAAAGGEYLWTAMCQDMTGVKAAECWEHMSSNETEKRNMCNAWFGN